MYEEVIKQFERKLSNAIIELDFDKALVWLDSITEYIIISFEYDAITFDESMRDMNKYSVMARKIKNLKERS